MRTVRVLAAALVLCFSGPAWAQYIDNYVKNHSLLMMAANGHATELGAISTVVFAELVRGSKDPHSRSASVETAKSGTELLRLVGQLLSKQWWGMNEHYSHLLTPRAFGKKRATKKDLKKNFKLITKWLNGGFRFVRLSALKISDIKLKKSFVTRCDASLKRLKVLSAEAKKQL